MIEVAEQPAAFDANPVGGGKVEGTAHRQLTTEIREIDAGIHRQLQGSPEAAVDFHQDGPSGSTVLLVFQHRDTMPREWAEQAHRLVPQLRVQGDALAEYALTARGWPFADAPMG